MAKDNAPRTNLCGDINKLVTPNNGKNNKTLSDKTARQPIGTQSGAGRDEAVVESSGVNLSGTYTSTDGLFTIVFE